MKENIRIGQSEPPIEKAILADAIITISDSVKKLERGGLNLAAIVALVKDDTGLSKLDINRVMKSLGDLRNNYCSK